VTEKHLSLTLKGNVRYQLKLSSDRRRGNDRSWPGSVKSLPAVDGWSPIKSRHPCG